MFGVSNQLLAAIALGVGTTLLLKEGKLRYVWVTAVPMAFMFLTTLTAAWQLQRLFWNQALVARGAEALTYRIDALLVLLMALLALVALGDMLVRWHACLTGREAPAVSAPSQP
jgi:carbon starvation protein